MKLPQTLKELLDGPNIAVVATLMPDGSPQCSTIWIERDGDLITFNTVEGRIKTDNLRRDGRVAIAVHDAVDPLVAAAVRGRVVQMSHEGADAQIDRLAAKYLRTDIYPWRTPGMQRVSVVIEADSVSLH